MKVHFVTHGCKANQYDTEKFRQELEARGAVAVDDPLEADACVVNTCTVTNNADAGARKAIRRLKRDNPDVQIIVAGCSAALRFDDYMDMDEVTGVVKGHDAVAVAGMVAPEAPLVDRDEEPIGGVLLEKNERGTRGWMKIQDGCNRRCSFCATKLARGKSRSRLEDDIVAEAEQLAEFHRELVFTGIHIGHYGHDLEGGKKEHTLSKLIRRLLDEVPDVRFRLGSIEATEIDDLMIDLLETSGGRLVPHLHVPMQAGSNAVLRNMRRWHTREQYRDRLVEIVERLPYLGLGADVIVGFPGETDEDFAQTRDLVETLPFTYLHVFPYSERDGTVAADMDDKIHGDIKSARSQELRELAQAKGEAYHRSRVGQAAEIVVEENNYGVTEDYLRVRLTGNPDERTGDLVYAPLQMDDGELIARV
ncbi:tRNA (N(6)-L-threonylcarbamoyladenosine(37)-C(2))-methylthiotransferase MtaB [Persicimonas caeni]|uniref:tRNA (N(6)-L-threonylcarbamoyladenosine(37)-C(2))-methylthiotransferase MtaB n=1 Tax=Persicimonas caeni TaxID=2292766 RepID=A0A4Y6PU69_PERCE|nr:tRNA (N(6)-L-threonylcarbamoyladenosine(37)-C(2))-methylthiotransferase MtaB [Persicimonas caeni]QDG51871.1 tRNA (N(6)-L-threonylcarbamoyladenosine(37)-C(2))-methylthiotransferase MtaB [Persicimonas caeni]QED33092.1 tRNA (N(6)-L-threonylcarbamoyladenosine(37)-C(2))-methylthiotransferase MtaB [Persicimonas caeni]